VGGGAQRERREGESCEFQHAQILFSVSPPRSGAPHSGSAVMPGKAGQHGFLCASRRRVYPAGKCRALLRSPMGVYPRAVMRNCIA
jgi:hypothetical protein